MITQDNIHIALVHTRYSGNIGAAARSMMNFGLKNMILVKPRCSLDGEAYEKARHASAIFENARIYNSLEDLAAEFPLMIGTSRRGAYRLHMRMTPRLSAEEISEKYSQVKTAIVFGDEKGGLKNEDLEKCAWYINIPSHKDFQSLNLAHSVTVIAYELFLQSRSENEDIYKKPANDNDAEYLFRHITSFLKAIDFPNWGSTHRTYADIKRVLSSADLKKTDVTLAHGFMRYIEEKYLGGWIKEDGD
jgi:TrmH family RNA methyltransferase